LLQFEVPDRVIERTHRQRIAKDPKMEAGELSRSPWNYSEALVGDDAGLSHDITVARRRRPALRTSAPAPASWSRARGTFGPVHDALARSS
jgi:hypothetical protein